jgi:hypothetical protein
MALAVEAPARDDLSFRTNDDKLIGARWYKSDATTPVVISAATLTLRFDPAPAGLGPDGSPLPPPDPEVHVITSTTPADPAGWFDAANLAAGVALATIPHGIWAGYEMRRGDWDLIAVGEGLQRCLVRGRFVAEEGFAT